MYIFQQTKAPSFEDKKHTLKSITRTYFDLVFSPCFTHQLCGNHGNVIKDALHMFSRKYVNPFSLCVIQRSFLFFQRDKANTCNQSRGKMCLNLVLFVCFAHSKLHLFAHNKRILINNRFSLITKRVRVDQKNLFQLLLIYNVHRVYTLLCLHLQ